MTMLGSPPPTPTGPPLAQFVGALEALLDTAGDAPAWTLTVAELEDLLPRLTRAEARLAEVGLRVLREADRHSVGADVGATNTPAWWAHVTGQRVPVARAAAHLAAQLDGHHDVTRAALARGSLHVEQARAIVDAVEALPAESVGPELVRDAETHLVGLADLDGDTRLDPRALRIAGRKILEVVAPDLAEQHERRVLEAEEREAAASAYLHLRPDGHGSVYGRFKIPVLHGEILAKHLAAIAAPRHQRATGTSTSATSVDGKRVARALRLGQALCEYVETRDTAADGSPRAGGMAATVVVTMTLEQLVGGLHGSEHSTLLDTGETISAAQARRLACEAGIIPAVLGSPSQPLDLGRRTRFHTEPQRTAVMLRDRGCAAIGCDWPPGMCHVHHRNPWSAGGSTSVADGILLCPRHHAVAHDGRYQLKTDKHGKVTFSRRT
jgi:hypothetical protein